MAICNWPPTERPREKLLNLGPAALSDAELLAIFLRTGCAGKSAVDLARDLLGQFNGLRQLLETDRATLCRNKGLGSAKYVQLQAALEIGRRHLQQGLKKPQAFRDAETVKQFLTSRLRHQNREVFAVLYLDNQHALIAFEELFKGSIDSAQVHPREIIKQALQHNASALILAHNHPSGCTQPSREDCLVTKDICHALALVDIKVLDHMIVGEGSVLSMAERRMLPLPVIQH